MFLVQMFFYQTFLKESLNWILKVQISYSNAVPRNYRQETLNWILKVQIPNQNCCSTKLLLKNHKIQFWMYKSPIEVLFC